MPEKSTQDGDYTPSTEQDYIPSPRPAGDDMTLTTQEKAREKRRLEKNLKFKKHRKKSQQTRWRIEHSPPTPRKSWQKGRPCFHGLPFRTPNPLLIVWELVPEGFPLEHRLPHNVVTVTGRNCDGAVMNQGVPRTSPLHHHTSFGVRNHSSIL